MDQDEQSRQYLESPAVAAIKQDARFGLATPRHFMERSFSQDIQEGTQELQAAAEQTRNIILDLSLDGLIRWVSPSWTEVLGTQLESVKGFPISQFIEDDPNVFEAAVEGLRSNNTKCQSVKFAVKIGTGSELQPMLDAQDAQSSNSSENQELSHELSEETGTARDEQRILWLEGQGIMIYDRASGSESHTMWMLQPAAEPIHIMISLPSTVIDFLGPTGAEVLAKYLSELAEAGAIDPAHHPPPMPVLCRVCERSITPWWFEKHSDLCVQEHKAEMDVQMVQESLTEQRHAIVKILDAFEARSSRSHLAEGPHAPPSTPEYKGQSIGPSPVSSSAVSSGLGSRSRSPAGSQSPTLNPSVSRPGHTRSKSFVVRRPVNRIVELVLDLCDTALSISLPTIKETRSAEEPDFNTSSPGSESNITQVLNWQTPPSLEAEPGLAALVLDTEALARSKVEAVRRHQFILEYSERIRSESTAEVDACIEEAIEKAKRAQAGEPFSSSESENEGQPEDVSEQSMSEEPTPLAAEPEDDRRRSMSYTGLRSLASALRNPHELPPVPVAEQHLASSQAVSTRSSSPAECPTPKSYRGNVLAQPQPIAQRRSAYLDDANDSDGSLHSSSILSGNWRADSPASTSDQGLSRTTSSRDRKRRSMHLHGLGSASPHRQQSPGRYPPAPTSPLRVAKSRGASGENGIGSPIVSPLLTTGEFMPPPTTHMHQNHHRRQSSMHSSDLRAPPSPRLSTTSHSSHPAQKVQPPSIKDFEIIKPISRGAFGSVYLSKKKLTGDYFAVKVLRKSDMVAKNQVTNVKAERAIMMWQGESDFVAKLYWTFSSKDYLYLVMEYLNGGDCGSLVKILGGLSEDWAKKYVAEVVLGVQHLHSRGIVHRDLKPDNLLIDSKGHLKLTDFGLSRMGLIGRQKRALKSPNESTPDLLKQGPFAQQSSNPTSRSASFDYHGVNSGSPADTPLMTPALAGGIDQPSYFSLNRESSLSRDFSRRASGHRGENGNISTYDLHHAFRNLGIQDSPEFNPSSVPSRGSIIEEESTSQGGDSPDLHPLAHSISNLAPIPPPAASSQMLPPATALFDPSEGTRRFVGTPDYIAPEIISGKGQDEMSDWWSLGCILFEFIYGVPPFNAETPDQVFDNIMHRRIAWPDEEEVPVSDEAKDLINKLIQLDPKQRLGANAKDQYPNGGAEIQAHPWFSDINWETLLQDEAQFVPNPENPEDTEYFDARGATLHSFPEEAEDQLSPAITTPGTADYADRPHDALFRAKTQASTMKRGLMPLHIPPHIARDSRTRRLSEPVIADDFGNFTFKNLPVLEKANKDIVERMRKEAMAAQARGYSSQAVSAANTPVVGSPSPSLDYSPLLPMPVKRALSISKHRPASPSGLGNSNSSPGRPSAPSSPLLVQFSAGQHERRKTSSSSHGSATLQPGNFFDPVSEAQNKASADTASPVRAVRMPAVSPAKPLNSSQRQSSTHTRARSQTVGSQDGQVETTLQREGFVPGHYKRRSQLFVRDVSPSSSDNENSAQAKALLKVQRRRQSSRRLSNINFDAPAYRPLDVLICEDHPVSKMVMERLLDRLRCRTITATSGPEALRLAISQIQFDIIFMEWKLPLINGVDVARMIRDTQSANTRTPLICITGYLKDLPETHQFDELMQKPATNPKLTEALAKFCAWKAPPKDFKLMVPLSIPPPVTRIDTNLGGDSPSSVASSFAPTMPDSSYKGSSRGDSIGSGFFSDIDSITDSIPLIMSRAPTEEWSKAGLGIAEDIVVGQKPYVQPGFPRLVHTESAPAAADLTQSTGPDAPTPRHQRSSEAIRAKREAAEKQQHTGSGAEEGDDEDDELGGLSRTRSPQIKARPTSKLGQEMLRTNSRGSVISMGDDRLAEPDSLKRSLEILEGRMEGLQIPEESIDESTLTAIQPRKMERTASQHSHPALESPPRPGSRGQGHITPPIIFPKLPGKDVKEIEIDPEQTPVPTPMHTKKGDFDDGDTPKPPSLGAQALPPTMHDSPSERD